MDYYLDTAATTPVHPKVLKTIIDVMETQYGNPSSIHTIGRRANSILKDARLTISEHINCHPDEIIITSGACEANSLAIKGFIEHYKTELVISPIEHKSILMLAKNETCLTSYALVDEIGRIDLESLDFLCQLIALKHGKFLVSIQAANSEIGTIQDIKAISTIVHKHSGIFHTDATQLFPYAKLDVQELGIDMLSMSGQKIHAPKGVGFLYVKKGIKLEPLIHGTQMENRRGGTENIPYIAGLQEAIKLLSYQTDDLVKNRDYLIQKLLNSGIDCRINGDLIHRLPNNINISFKNVDAETLLLLLDSYKIYVSSGSACNGKGIKGSDTLNAICVPEDYRYGTIRITLPEGLTFNDLDYIAEKILNAVSTLRSLR